MKNTPTLGTGLLGDKTIEELTQSSPIMGAKLGKQAIADAGARLRQIAGLKPGQASIRTPQMIDEMVDRLRSGETLTSIHCDPTMPANGTLWNWREADPVLDERIRRAQAQGQHVLSDLRLNIAFGGEMSTGDARRDELVIKTIKDNIAVRNRAEFGERVQVDHKRVDVHLPDWASKMSAKAEIVDVTVEEDDE